MSPSLPSQLAAELARGGLLTDAAARRVYARDASHMTLGEPVAVALPSDADEVAAVVRACIAAGVPLVARGAGTGLSGGAVPPEGAVVLATGRLNRIGQANLVWPGIRVEPGVLNEQVSRAAAGRALHFAPDPSSQSASAIGGNIAENAGGPHCLRHGVTLQHLRRLEWVGADGRRLATGDGALGARGFDLVSLLCGSEGTLGIVTAADLKLTPDPARVGTLLAFFPALDAATRTVVDLLGAGLLPVAVEMVDQAMLEAVEQAFAFGFPTDVEAAMIVEFGDDAEAVAEDTARARELLLAGGAHEVRLAADAAERAELWKCRKKAFGAVGRLAPNYVTMDVVVPLGELPDLVAEIQRIKARHGVEIATAFHAGDGNLHPGVHYDDRDPESGRAAHAAADEIIADAIRRGGSATGEHGVGIEKLHALPWQMDAVTARLHHRIARAWDPQGLLNPGKLLPDPAAEYAAMPPVPAVVASARRDMTITAPAAARLSEVQAAAAADGLWLPVGLPGPSGGAGLGGDPTIGDLVDHLATGPLLLAGASTRDLLLAGWFGTAADTAFRSGAPVFKNVAGYGLHHALCGAGGVWAATLGATFALRPRPEAVRGLTVVPGDAPDATLAVLWGWLRGCGGGTAGATAVVEADGETRILLPGRDRPWDLARKTAALEAAVAPHGGRVREEGQVAFAEAAELAAAFLPGWALSGPDWWAIDPLPATAEAAPPGGGRLVFLAGPGRFWSPDVPTPRRGWANDHVIAGGVVSPLPEPAAGVPRDLLAALQEIFDPDGLRAVPDWLAAAGREVRP
ncbi:FAD-binding protein [bacterium]|nr:FAD-binding protein [bacterium]